MGGLSGSAARPQLSASQAANLTVLKYLAQAGAVTAPATDNWDPTAGVADVAAPAFTVAATGGTHTTVQAAITAAVTQGGTARIGIKVMPGTYRELVCVPANAPPITLFGAGTDAAATTIVFNNLAGLPVPATTPTNPCTPPSATATTYGTAGSSTFVVFASNMQVKNLTISNDADETTLNNPATQGVALYTRGDKLVFDNVRVLGNQDTILVNTPSTITIARAYFKACYVEGDIDFICGRGTAVFDGGEIKFVSNRRPTGNILAPSTEARNPYGLLVTGAMFTASTAPPTAAGAVTLGRAWDESQMNTTFYATSVATGAYPNGQALIRGSMLGAQIAKLAPWAPAATTSRPFSSTAGAFPANRLYEYMNSGAGAAP